MRQRTPIGTALRRIARYREHKLYPLAVMQLRELWLSGGDPGPRAARIKAAFLDVYAADAYR